MNPLKMRRIFIMNYKFGQSWKILQPKGLSSLLKLLQKYFNNLLTDFRALLNTQRKTVLKVIESGIYYIFWVYYSGIYFGL